MEHSAAGRILVALREAAVHYGGGQGCRVLCDVCRTSYSPFTSDYCGHDGMSGDALHHGYMFALSTNDWRQAAV